MKRTLAILGLCTLVAVVVVIAFVGKTSARRGAQSATNQVTLTPDGKLTILPPDNFKGTIVATLPKQTNLTSSATNTPGNK
jgi:hypothetical protein